ncbi:xanthine dehydrogenase, partial [Sinorhizobium medicae]
MTENAQRRTTSGGDQFTGKAVDRVDGPRKVTGTAHYAYEIAEGPLPAYGYILGAAIAKGRILEIDAELAERAPGVLYVMTHLNAPRQPEFGPAVTPAVREVFTRARPVLRGDDVHYYDQPVGLVVAETLEAARAAAALIKIRYQESAGDFGLEEHLAAALIKIRYQETAGDFGLEEHLAAAYAPKRTNAGFETDSAVGDFETAFAEAEVRIDVSYRTPYQHHNPMEPHATLAIWQGDDVTIHTSAQTLSNFRAGLAATLGVPVERVRVVSRYIGGGFGSKLIVHADSVFAALAARILKRPVKITLTRQQ